MKKCYRVVAYILSAIIVFITIFSSYCQSVYAAGVSDFLWNSLKGFLINKGYSITDDLYSGLEKYASDVIFGDGELHTWSDYSGFDGFILALVESEEYGIIDTSSNVYTDSSITLSASTLDMLEKFFQGYLAENPEVIDVVWVPVVSSDQLSASAFYSTTQYYQFRSYADEVPYSLINTNGDGWYFFRFKDVSDFILYKGYGSFTDGFINQINMITSIFGRVDTTGSLNFTVDFATSGGVVLSDSQLMYDGAYMDSGLTTTSAFFRYDGDTSILYPFKQNYLSTVADSGDVYIVRGSKTDAVSYIPVFSNLNSYRDWITGNGIYYRFDSDYAGGDITINPDADYSEITDAIRDAMQQAIQSGKSVTDALSSMQKAFTVALGKINSTLGDISDNTQQTNEWLQKIYELLEQQQEELLEYFESSGQSLDDLIGLLSHTDSDGSRTSIYDLLGSFLLLFRVQQEDLQAYMDDAQNFFKTLPVKIGALIKESAQDITDAIQDVVDAIDGIRINIDYGDVDGDGSDGESLWKLLGEGVAKILTSILGLLKVLIFKGLDALVYLVGVVVDNVNGVFDELTLTVDAVIADLEESNALYADLGEAIPVQVQNILVLFVFVLGFCAILSYLRR